MNFPIDYKNAYIIGLIVQVNDPKSLSYKIFQKIKEQKQVELNSEIVEQLIKNVQEQDKYLKTNASMVAFNLNEIIDACIEAAIKHGLSLITANFENASKGNYDIQIKCKTLDIRIYPKREKRIWEFNVYDLKKSEYSTIPEKISTNVKLYEDPQPVIDMVKSRLNKEETIEIPKATLETIVKSLQNLTDEIKRISNGK